MIPRWACSDEEVCYNEKETQTEILMPYTTTNVGKGKVRVTSPNGVKAKATTPAKAAAQVRLLRGVEHGWHPTGKKRGGVVDHIR